MSIILAIAIIALVLDTPSTSRFGAWCCWALALASVVTAVILLDALEKGRI